MGFNLFGSDSTTRTSNDNAGAGATQDGNNGSVALNGSDNSVSYRTTTNNTTTDHGAVSAGVAVAQSGLAVANNSILEAVQSAANNATTAINAGVASAANALDFGTAALDANGYSQGLAIELGRDAIELATGGANSLLDAVGSLANEVLVNGEKATSQALSVTERLASSETANSADLMVKAGAAIAIAAVVALIFVGGKR